MRTTLGPAASGAANSGPIGPIRVAATAIPMIVSLRVISLPLLSTWPGLEGDTPPETLGDEVVRTIDRANDRSGAWPPSPWVTARKASTRREASVLRAGRPRLKDLPSRLPR